MRRPSVRSYFKGLLVIGAIAVLTSLIALPSLFGGTVAMQSPRVDDLFNESKTVCIGRFLIEVPMASEVVYGPAEVPFSLKIFQGKGPALDTVVLDRLAEIQNERRSAEGSLLNEDAVIGKVMDGPLAGQKIVFGVSKRSGVFYRIQSYLSSGDDLFVHEVDSIASKEDYEIAAQKLSLMARRLHSRSDLEIPQTPGICIDHGFVDEPPESMREYVTLGVRLQAFPDVHFSISTTNKMKWLASDALEPRLKRAEKNANAEGNGAWYSRIKTLRRGTRALGRWKGFEILTWMPAQAGQGESHEFRFLSQGEPKNPLLPLLELELRTGVRGNDIGGTKPSISDEEAMALWDQLTNSIRVRPTTPTSN